MIFSLSMQNYTGMIWKTPRPSPHRVGAPPTTPESTMSPVLLISACTTIEYYDKKAMIVCFWKQSWLICYKYFSSNVFKRAKYLSCTPFVVAASSSSFVFSSTIDLLSSGRFFSPKVNTTAFSLSIWRLIRYV